MLLRAVGAKQIQAKTVLFDSWYGSWQNLKLVQRLGLTFYTTLKANRLVSLSQKMAIFISSDRLERRTAWHGIIVKLKKVPFKVRLFKVVAPNGDIDWVITNDLDETVITQVAQNANELRWQVEEFHRAYEATDRLRQMPMSQSSFAAQSSRLLLPCLAFTEGPATLLNKTIYRVHTDLFSDYLRNQLRRLTIPAFQPA